MCFRRAIIILSFFLTTQACAQVEVEKIDKSEAYQVGLMVHSLQRALSIRDEEALQTISQYGTDSRYYSMIRGWLFQELVSVESQLHANKNSKLSESFQNHSNFLKSAIRRIDLE